ncbi:homoaconitate hydratase family protein [Puteibacter caeruleilacunae]|nr:homoaconitate hydratase family protein [Puteibacter caeruleilacunae]
MTGKTFVEKIFGASEGSIVFQKPDLVLTHDNTSSIEKIFSKMGGEQLADRRQSVVVLDHNAPPTNAKLANDYDAIRRFVTKQGIERFHDAGSGICHQLMSKYAKPGMVIVGSDSHTCTAGAFNSFAAGIDRTEAAGVWKRGETWFRVPESIKITLCGKLNYGCTAKDLSLYIIGMLGSSGANYMSIEYHGDGVRTLTVSDRMTVANLASEMGAKNAVFPCDEVLRAYLGNEEVVGSVWADDDAQYTTEYVIHLKDVEPLIACPHHVDHVKTVSEVEGKPIQEAVIGTCTNGRIEDLRAAALMLQGKKIAKGVQLLIIPASREIYLQALQEGLIRIFVEAGGNVLAPSCGPCLGTGQGIPADGWNVISTANRNFLGRMGNKNVDIYLASPITVALSAINGKITCPNTQRSEFPFTRKQSEHVEITQEEERCINGVWNYGDVDNLNTDQMFAGKRTYEINSSEPDKIAPFLFEEFDPKFAVKASLGDIILAGDNFGCGSSREHPSVGLVYKGIKGIIVKSVARIFFRSAVNQGLPIIVLPEAVDYYKKGDCVDIDLSRGVATVGDREFPFEPLPEKLLDILQQGGLVKWIEKENINN